MATANEKRAHLLTGGMFGTAAAVTISLVAMPAWVWQMVGQFFDAYGLSISVSVFGLVVAGILYTVIWALIADKLDKKYPDKKQ